MRFRFEIDGKHDERRLLEFLCTNIENPKKTEFKLTL